MLNSKESLEHICKNCDNECCPYIHYEQSRCSFYGVIKQDLDRLEELKKENERLKKDLKALEIIKEHRFLFVEKGQLYVGRYGDVELLLEEDDFQDEHEYELLKEVLENE